MYHLGLKNDNLVALGGLYTAKEIGQQPALWKKIWDQVNAQKNEIKSFLAPLSSIDKVILTGAGTSAFIGASLEGVFYRKYNSNTIAIPTTHLVSHPCDYFSKDQSILLISFARSGNSPESKAAVALADEICEHCHHLIITCNPDGELATYQSKNSKLVFVLPPESNDKSLAMTSSYTGMLLSAILMARIEEISALETQVNVISEYGRKIIEDELSQLRDIALLPFKRVVFLGSGPLYGTATESHLKVQELSDGNVICKHDSFLGFRHGPKAVVDNETLMVYLFSNSSYVAKYENDLIRAMEKGKKALAHVGIMEQQDHKLPLDYSIVFAANGKQKVDEEFLSVVSVVPSQILAFFKSVNEGLSPDTPSASGAISRVVEGVNIYTHSNPQQI